MSLQCRNVRSSDLTPIKGGLYAPTIRYRNGTFYLLCTIVTHNDPPKKSHAFANFILQTNDIYGNNWSNAIYFDYYAFDPSLFFDDDGKAYVHGASMPGPKTTIDLFEIDLNTGEKLTEQKTIWTGITKFFPEGPHIYKKDGYYYCLIAEDGTHEFHAVKIARSRNLYGPYEAYENNPLLSAAGTNDYYNHLGHAELFQDIKGDWWCVCLGVRKVEGRFVLGRETFITQASWPEGEWPTIEPIKANPDHLSALQPRLTAKDPRDELLFIRKSNLNGYRFEDGRIFLRPSKQDLTHAVGHEPISFVGKRQRALDYTATLTLANISATENSSVRAGLGYFKDEHRWATLCYDFGSREVCFQFINDSQKIKDSSRRQQEWQPNIDFLLKCTEQEYTFSYRIGEEQPVEMGRIDTLQMSDYDFTGPIIGALAFDAAPAGGDASSEGVEVEFSRLELR